MRRKYSVNCNSVFSWRLTVILQFYISPEENQQLKLELTKSKRRVQRLDGQLMHTEVRRQVFKKFLHLQTDKPKPAFQGLLYVSVDNDKCNESTIAATHTHACAHAHTHTFEIDM